MQAALLNFLGNYVTSMSCLVIEYCHKGLSIIDIKYF